MVELITDMPYEHAVEPRATAMTTRRLKVFGTNFAFAILGRQCYDTALTGGIQIGATTARTRHVRSILSNARKGRTADFI